MDEIIKKLGSEFCNFLWNIEGNEFAYKIGCMDADDRYIIGFIVACLLIAFMWGILTHFLPWLRF